MVWKSHMALKHFTVNTESHVLLKTVKRLKTQSTHLFHWAVIIGNWLRMETIEFLFTWNAFFSPNNLEYLNISHVLVSLNKFPGFYSYGYFYW